MSLTAKRVGRVKKPGRYSDGHGLVLQVQEGANGITKSWLFRYQRNGRERWLGLGPTFTVTLKDARERARAARLQLLDGIDPLDAKAAVKQAAALEAAKTLTFEAAANRYFDQHADKWTNRKHRKQFLSTMKDYVFPVIGKLSVAAVDTGLVLKCIEPIWPTKAPTANRVRARIESVLDWATVRGYRTGDNPARWRGHLGEVLPARRQIKKAVHHPALPYVEIPGFMAALRERSGVAARALEFTILTAARTGEVLGAQWSEFDLDAKVWVVPAGRMKGGREHRVPLPDNVVTLLRALPTEEGNPFVFIGFRGAGLSHMAMDNALKRIRDNGCTVHGFRSTFRDWTAERTAFPHHVAEQALAHTIGSAVERAYRRGDLYAKRTQLMKAWASYCGQPAKAGEVVALRGSP
jgi:integrase